MPLSFSGRLRLLFFTQSLVSLLFIISVGYENALFPNDSERQIKSSLAFINKVFFLNFAAERVLYFDEVLTQSARNAVLTQQPEWETRYWENERSLAKFITMGLKLRPYIGLMVAKLQQANNNLVKMEEQAFAFSKMGRPDLAIQILNSSKYKYHKRRYAHSVSEFTLPNDDSFYRKFGQTHGQLNRYMSEIGSLWDNLQWSLIFFPVILLGVHLSFVLVFLQKFGLGVRNLKMGIKRIESGEYNVRIPEVPSNELGKLAVAFNRMSSELNFLNHAFQEQRIQEELSKQRRAFRKDLHDRLTTLLASLKLHLELFKRDSSKVQGYIETSESLLKEAYFQLREISEGPGSNEIRKVGLLHSLKDLIQRIGLVYNVPVRFSKQIGEEDLANLPRHELYAMVLEITGNALRHSQASEILLDIKKYHQFLWLVIADNGTGFHTSVETALENGNGLRNMLERAQSLGGTMEIETMTGKGTMITIKIPL